MLLYLVSRILSVAGAFLYPTYASYKTLSRRPASETDLERWLMYWSVLGVLLAAEYTAEWTISWIPFYYPVKTLFLLYLALPQTRGASYIYTAQLRPRLAAHEDDIDAAIRRAREASVKWAQRQLRSLWTHFASNASVTMENLSGDLTVGAVEGVREAASAAPQPTQRDPVSGPVNIAYGLWHTYFSAIMTSIQAPQPPTVSRTQNSPPLSASSPPPVSAHTSALDDSRSLLARRRALEAELAALPPLSSSPPIERVVSSTYLPAQENDRGRYEEIAPDDADLSVGDSGGSGEDGPPPTQRRGSWWWGRSDGYERVKTE